MRSWLVVHVRLGYYVGAGRDWTEWSWAKRDAKRLTLEGARRVSSRHGGTGIERI